MVKEKDRNISTVLSLLGNIYTLDCLKITSIDVIIS